jgi:pyroglutamyl-peptidase
LSEPTVLFTGFEPFGGHEENPSWGVALAAAAATQGAQAVRLPVTYATAAEFPDGLATPPDLVVQIGLSARRGWISLERIARNVSGDQVDNAGTVGPDLLDDGGPEELETPLDVEELATRLGAAVDHEVRVSESAGDYVCNALYFHSLRRATRSRVLFVHVPELDAEGQRKVGEALARALKA